MTTQERKQYNKNYYQTNKDKLHTARRERYKKDPLLRLKESLSSAVRKGLTKYYTYDSMLRKIIGLPFSRFRIHIASQFKPGMSWANRDEWHLDHIKPLSSAKNEKELIKLFNYKNYRPLWAEDNQKKGDRL